MKNVDIHERGPHVDHHRNLLVGHRVAQLEGVSRRDGVDIDDRGGKTCVLDHGDVVVYEVALHSDEEDVHLGRVFLQRADHLEIDPDVLDVEGDVLLHLPLDRLLQLFRGGRGENYFLDDHGMAGKRGGDLLLLHLELAEGGLDPFDYRDVVHDRPVHDRVRGKREDPELPYPELHAHSLDMGELDGARPDIQPDQLFRSEHHHGTTRPVSLSC
jgi:hypothetical protein